MIVLVTGGRDYWKVGVVLALDLLHQDHPITLLVHGGADGADRHSADWASAKGIHTARIDALWEAHGNGAGSKRNTAMALLAPAIDLVVAFPGGVGTADMVDKAQDAGLRVWEPYPE